MSMPISKEDAQKFLRKRVSVTYTQKYTNGRSEKRTEVGKLIEVSETGLTLAQGTTSFPGFGRVPVETQIGLKVISEIKVKR